MSETFDSVYPDFLQTGLGKLNQLDGRRELLGLFTALENFRRDLHSQDSAAGILGVTSRYIGGLNLFASMGFWLVNPADFNFELSLARPAETGQLLQDAVDENIRAGRFAQAIRVRVPQFFQTSDASGRASHGVLHTLALSGQVVGMFCGQLQAGMLPTNEIAFSLLSLLLGGTADALATLRKTKQLVYEVETLSKLLPLCAWCKKIRNDGGYWEQIEKYLSAHSDSKVTHGICPDCYSKFLASGAKP
jgi:hypothetical protein